MDGATRVERRVLEIGRIKGGEVEVVSGLSPGDSVVIRGHAALLDGAAISARNPDGSPAVAASHQGAAPPAEVNAVSLTDISIKRPVLTLMMTLSMVVFGVLGYYELGVDQMPNMEFPVVTVIAQLEGASPETMEEDVTEVLEEHLNTIGGLRSLKSTTFHGITMISAEFELERDIDQAAQDVRDKVARARIGLPRELEPPVIDKRSMSSRPIIWLPLNSDRSQVEVTEYLKYTVKPYLETINGVASTELFGRRERAIRIWVDGEALRARGPVRDGPDAAPCSASTSTCRAGASRATRSSTRSRPRPSSRTSTSSRSLVVADVDGAPVRLGDVARVEDGAEDARLIARFNGGTGAGIGILKQSAREHGRDRRPNPRSRRRAAQVPARGNDPARSRVRDRLLDRDPRVGRRDAVRAGLRRGPGDAHRAASSCAAFGPRS